MTFGDMVSYVSKRALDPNNTAIGVADVQQAINDAISYYSDTKFDFNVIDDEVTLTAGNPVIPFPSNFLLPVMDDGSFYISYSNQRYPLVKESQMVYDNYYLSNGQGLPRRFAPTATGYVVDCIPQLNYTIGRHYIQQYPALVNPTDTNDFTINAGRMVCLLAIANLVAELREDLDSGPYYRQAAEDEYRNQLRRTNKKYASGSLTIYN